MWPFTRKPEASAPAAPAQSLPQVHFDWKGLPPIQRTVADHPLTVPTQQFAAGLSTHDDPRTVAEPLSHGVSLQAPPGIALDIVRPQPQTRGPELVPRTQAKRTVGVQRAADESSIADETNFEGGATEDLPAMAPAMNLPVSAERPPSAQLTRVSPESLPQPLPVQRVATAGEEHTAPAAAPAEPAGGAIELPSYPRLTLGQARRLGLGAPMHRVPETATNVQRSAEPSPAWPGPSSPPPAASAAQEIPQFTPYPLDFLVNKRREVVAPAPISRPQRIGLPLNVSRFASESRAVDLKPANDRGEVDGLPAATPTPPSPASVQRLDETTADHAERAASLSPAGEADPTAELAGLTGISADTDPKSTLLASTAKGETQESSVAQPPALPLAGGKISEPGVREGADEPASLSEARGHIDGPASFVSDGTPAQSNGMRDRAPLVSERPQLITATRSPLSTPVQRTTDTPSSSVGPAIDGLRRQVPFLSIQRVESSSWPSPENAWTLDSSDGPASAPPANGSERLAGPSLPLARPREALATSPLTPTRTTPTVQTSSSAESWPVARASTALLEPSFEDAAPATVQRQASAEWAVSAARDEAAIGPSAAPAAGAEAAASGGDEETRMEDLAAKLYDRIRGRLRSELLVDRERAGFLTDLR
ncbi:MAG TPA: hypothetical protein VFR68_02300 [Candidatus Dormibacteraeota bacterium]|nr:hypothetical protein [Candidatus Dormibacteraeota bacterium]